MNKLWICLGFLAVFGQAHAFSKSEYDYEDADKQYPDISDEYDDKPSDSDALGFKVNIDENGKVFYDEAFEDTFKILGNDTFDVIDQENKDEIGNRDSVDDYQIEDNRSEVRDDKEQDSGELIENADGFDLDRKDSNMEIKSDEITSKKSIEMEENKNDDSNDMLLDYDGGLLEEESEDVDENVADMGSVKDSEDNNFEDKRLDDLMRKQEVYNKEVNEHLVEPKNETEKDNYAGEALIDLYESQNSNNEEIFAATKKILEETNESFDEEIDNEEIDDADNDNEEEDDINSSEDKSDTYSEKENNIDSEGNAVVDEENNNSTIKSNTNTQKTSTKSIEIKESSTEKQNLDDVIMSPSELLDDLNELRETWMKLKDEVNDANIVKENLPGFDELDTKIEDIAQEVKDNEFELVDEKGSLDSRLVLEEFPAEDLDDEEIDDLDEGEEEEEEEVEPELIKSVVDGTELAAKEKSDKSKLIKYVDDALIANEDPDIREKVTDNTTKHAPLEHPVEPLEDSNDLINAFINNDLETNILEPTRITLSVDKPVVLTSPNYPYPYPPNAIHDWILEGKGRGIEFNITDFALHSVNGDYVVLKPGRVDPSGNDGIILSYGQSSPRKFRFLDVDRMFIRFEAKDGPNPFQGFSFSVKMFRPLADLSEVEPEPEPIGYPEASITLNLGGLTPEEFRVVQEEFRRIVADMATMYIEDNQIEHGRNTTLEVTQITSTAMCFHNWPQFDKCVEVMFGVPLQYDEDVEPRLSQEDLRSMWFTYSGENPFALRLQRIGITDFQVPNDTKILVVWLVIAAGVVISMAMLAFALWRFSCFEDYTRMPTFSDTESLGEKKTLELYPTPHQTLPPLYSDTEYKWGADCTAVDMGGFANRSYVRSDDYDFESEEDVAVPARDRYTTDV